MHHVIKILTILILGLGFISCDRIKDKTDQAIGKFKDNTKEEFLDQSQRVYDRVYPQFDHDKSDTENNRKGFVEFLKVELTADIKNIYCYDDAIGIDTDYMFSFNCNIETSKKIIITHKLKIDTLDLGNGFALQHDFEWWDKKRIETLKRYSWTNGNQYYKYYWYDNENNKAYFFDFDM
ncbi:MAG: hypothetical protein Kapaf2KO_19520 [Candidatus Kapaibacteriales bacterium]